MVYNVQPKYRNTLRGTYAGDQYDASGWQRGTLMFIWDLEGLSVGPKWSRTCNFDTLVIA